MGSVPKSALSALRAVPLFSRCTEKELKEIAGLGTPITLAAGRELTESGQKGREFFILLSGKAVCHVGDKEVATFGPGDFFGEMALLDGNPRSATVVAEGQVDALIFDSREFLRLVEASPSLALKMLESMASRLRQADISIQS